MGRPIDAIRIDDWRIDVVPEDRDVAERRLQEGVDASADGVGTASE